MKNYRTASVVPKLDLICKQFHRDETLDQPSPRRGERAARNERVRGCTANPVISQFNPSPPPLSPERGEGRRLRLCRLTRPAFTLTELLVTMLISLTIMAIALPLVKFNLDESRVREASRQLNAMFAKAKAQAALAGRPVGIMFLRDQTDTNRCRQFLLAEVPAPFGGTVTNSICNSRHVDGPMELRPKFHLTFPLDSAVVADLVKHQDAARATSSSKFGIRFDYKGPVHEANFDPTGTPTFWISSLPDPNKDKKLFDPMYPNDPTNIPNPQLIPSSDPVTNSPHSFQIYRLPTAINTQPIELTRGTYISLFNSGFSDIDNTATGLDEFGIGGTDPVIIMMSPNGHFSSYYVNNQLALPISTVHFLVVRERNETATSLLNNPINDPTNLWVSVGHLSGTVTTSDNQPGASPRYYAQRHDIRGGR